MTCLPATRPFLRSFPIRLSSRSYHTVKLVRRYKTGTPGDGFEPSWLLHPPVLQTGAFDQTRPSGHNVVWFVIPILFAPDSSMRHTVPVTGLPTCTTGISTFQSALKRLISIPSAGLSTTGLAYRPVLLVWGLSCSRHMAQRSGSTTPQCGHRDSNTDLVHGKHGGCHYPMTA